MLPHTTFDTKLPTKQKTAPTGSTNAHTHTHNTNNNTDQRRIFFNFVHTRRLLINCQLQIVLYASPGFNFGLPSFCLDFFGPTPPFYFKWTKHPLQQQEQKHTHTYIHSFVRTYFTHKFWFFFFNSKFFFLIINYVFSPV